MRALLLAAVASILMGSMSAAQTRGRASEPAAQSTPFGADWARPYPRTGGYIYYDPRLRNDRRSSRRNVVCPTGRRFDPAARSCR
jgi:hypothetical protein